MQVYSAQDVMSILDKAHDLGVRIIKIPGFEATWDLGSSRPKIQEKPKSRADVLGDYVIPIGKKLKGYKLKEANHKDLVNLLNWLKETSDQGEDLSNLAQEFQSKASEYLKCVGNEG